MNLDHYDTPNRHVQDIKHPAWFLSADVSCGRACLMMLRRTFDAGLSTRAAGDKRESLQPELRWPEPSLNRPLRLQYYKIKCHRKILLNIIEGHTVDDSSFFSDIKKSNSDIYNSKLPSQSGQSFYSNEAAKMYSSKCMIQQHNKVIRYKWTNMNEYLNKTQT